MRTNVNIPLSTLDNYLTQTFKDNRYLKSFNRGLRGISIPVGDFHEGLHKQAVFNTAKHKRSDISHLSNIYSIREPRYDAVVLEVYWCEKQNKYMAVVDWDEDTDVPDHLRVTAVMRGKYCLRVLQFGVE